MKRKIEPKIMIRAIKHLSSDLPCKNRVYLNQMFKNVFAPIFSESEEDYTLTYGDFNGLGKFNKQHGEDAGTQVLETITDGKATVAPISAMVLVKSDAQGKTSGGVIAAIAAGVVVVLGGIGALFHKKKKDKK